MSGARQDSAAPGAPSWLRRHEPAWRRVLTTVAVLGALASMEPRAYADGVGLTTDMALETTYVFRGTPQYNTEEIPTLHLAGRLESAPTGGRFFLQLDINSALAQRGANSTLGAADELVTAAGGVLQLAESHVLELGASAALRPSSSPVDIREEVYGRYEWRILDSDQWQVWPYLGVYGEAHRMQGAYGQLGLSVRRALGYDVYWRGTAWGGLSTYVLADADYNAAGGSVALEFKIRDDLVAAARFSGSISRSVRQYEASDFIEEHGVFWSGVLVRYAPVH